MNYKFPIKRNRYIPKVVRFPKFSASGRWSLVTGHWSLVTGKKPETRNQKPVTIYFRKLKLFQYIISFLCNLLVIGHVASQDSHLSQFDASPMFLNPSLTGMYSGDYRLYLNYRNQWSAVGTKPWVTSALSYDMPYQRFGMGAFIMDNRAGTGGFNVLNFLLSGAYEITQDPKKYNHLSVGLQLGFIHKYFNPSNYVFDNQYSTANGGGFDNTLPVGETFTTTAIWLPESNMGVYYYNSNDQAKINPFGGFSLFHITSPKESFFGTDNRLPRRFVFHGGANFYPSDAITLVPIYLFMREKNVNELNIGILGYYNWNAGKSEDNNSKKSEIILIFGPTYRNKDAVVLHLGLIYKEFEYKVSYDINTSPLNTVSNYRGGFELSVIYKKPKTVRPPSLELY